jgi:hypothetical protein
MSNNCSSEFYKANPIRPYQERVEKVQAVQTSVQASEEISAKPDMYLYNPSIP